MATKRTNTKTKADRFTSNDPMHITNKDFERMYAGQPATNRGKAAKGTAPVRAAANRALGGAARAAFAEHGRRIDERNKAGTKKTGEKKVASTGRKGKK